MAPATMPDASAFPPLETATPTLTGFITMSSAAPPTSTAFPPWGGSGNGGVPEPNREASTQMYLFTFLATVALLTIVAVGLVWRAIYVRRRYHRELVVAMARGDPLPNYRSPFIARFPTPPKKAPDLGPMPRMWQNEMRLDAGGAGYKGCAEEGEGEKGVRGAVSVVNAEEEDSWRWLSPVSLHSIRQAEPEAPAPVIIPEMPTIGAEFRDALRDMWPRRSRNPPRVPRPTGPPEPPIEMEPPIVGEVPEVGTEVRLGVLIALPCEGEGASRWTPMDPVEAEVPEVVVGVMECVVGEGVGDGTGESKWKSNSRGTSVRS